MADEEQLAVLRQGGDVWNAWREQNPDVRVDLFGADLSRLNLSRANLQKANLQKANLQETNLQGANLQGANLAEANLEEADLTQADLYSASLYDADLPGANLTQASLSGADLSSAGLARANLTGANLSRAHLNDTFLLEAKLIGARLDEANLWEARVIRADLRGANLSRAHLVDTDFTGADLTGCQVYGISAWDLKLDEATQKDLIITPGSPGITVDNLEIAQFIYLLLNNKRIRHVIETITSKVVLILGRFTDERKVVLDAIREELRQHDYTPVLFDFEKPRSRSTEETVSTLAHMARFVIADLTDAKSVLQELRAIVPTNPSVPVQPLILATQEEPGTFDFFRQFPWMLEPYRYPDPTTLLAGLKEKSDRSRRAKTLEHLIILRRAVPPAAELIEPRALGINLDA